MIIDGTKIAKEIRAEIKQEIQFFSHLRQPCLAVIQVGDNPASNIYIKNKIKACTEVGILSKRVNFPPNVSEHELLSNISELNKDGTIDGILVQLPLPAHINPVLINRTISVFKDVDGFHPYNLGKLLLGETDGFFSCTPLGIITLLQRINVSTVGKRAVILGRSNIVGKPLAALLMQNAPTGNATVTVLHSKSPNIAECCRQADILIAAIGSPRFVTADMVKEGAVVIDVGINREGEGLIGDTDFASILPKCSAITPVPGGVGPMTIAMLLSNTLKSYKQHEGLNT